MGIRPKVHLCVFFAIISALCIALSLGWILQFSNQQMLRGRAQDEANTTLFQMATCVHDYLGSHDPKYATLWEQKNALFFKHISVLKKNFPGDEDLLVVIRQDSIKAKLLFAHMKDFPGDAKAAADLHNAARTITANISMLRSASDRVFLKSLGDACLLILAFVLVIVCVMEILRRMTVTLHHLEQQSSARRQAEEALTVERYLMNNLLEHTPDHVYFKNTKSQFIRLSRTLAEHFGLKNPADAEGKTDFDFFEMPHSGQAFDDEQGIITSGEPVIDKEEREDWPDGHVTWASTTKVPLRNDLGNIVGTFGISRDVTDKKAALDALQVTMRKLEISNKELENFAYIASHDLQEPLRMVSSFTQMLKKRYAGKLDSDADEYIGFAVDGAKRMQRLLNDLLEYSRVTSKARPLAATDAERVFTETLDNLQLAIEDAHAVITHDPLPRVLADEVQLMQLFQNLLSNALKFQVDGVAPIIHVGVRAEGARWIFSVRDNGIGIAEEYFSQIFLIFQRVRTQKEYPGTGVGLAICSKIVERHEGKIWVESEPGKGTTFYFSLKKAPGEIE
ncbi:TPA: hypothetical protein DDW35_02755 [Candidatus Sumerlaeota bacterium]|nr:hypothetical protein [Candidatus Sumerlaeota bacterium]